MQPAGSTNGRAWERYATWRPKVCGCSTRPQGAQVHIACHSHGDEPERHPHEGADRGPVRVPSEAVGGDQRHECGEGRSVNPVGSNAGWKRPEGYGRDGRTRNFSSYPDGCWDQHRARPGPSEKGGRICSHPPRPRARLPHAVCGGDVLHRGRHLLVVLYPEPTT